MGRRGNYIGGGTIIGSSGSWPTLDPAASSSEMIRGKKEYKPSQQGKRHKRHGRVVQRSKEQRSKHLKEIFATNDIIPAKSARTLIEKKLEQIKADIAIT